MAGHVYVVPGDITRLSADAIAYSTDSVLAGDGLMHQAFADNVPSFSEQFSELRDRVVGHLKPCDTFWLPLPHERRPRGVVVASVAGWPGPDEVGCARQIVENTLRTAIAELRRSDRPLPYRIALPAFLAGLGGGWDRLVEVATPQLEAAEAFVREHDADVVFVTFSDSTYHAWTTARRRARERQGPASRAAPRLPEALVDALRAGECALFVGSGLSAGAGLPGWRALVDALADALGIPPEARREDTDYFLDLAQWYRDARCQPPVERRVAETFAAARTGALPTVAHSLIASLPVRFYVTTNYDDLIETALESRRRHPVRVVSDQDVARTGGTQGCYVVKFHGCAIAGGEVVLSRDDYESLLRRRPALALLLEGLLLNQSFFFLGYGLRDPDFRQIYHQVSAMHAEAQRPAYATTLDEASEHRRRQWQRKGLEITFVEGGSRAEQARTLDAMLDDLLERVRGQETRFLGEERHGTATPALDREWTRLKMAATAVAEGCRRIGRADRHEALAVANAVRFFSSMGWRGEGPGQVAAALAQVASHPGLERREKLELLVAALEAAADAAMVADLRRRIDETERGGECSPPEGERPAEPKSGSSAPPAEDRMPEDPGVEIDARVAERDIDFLVLEELVANPPFRPWFAGQLGLPPPSRLVAAGRSVVTPVGESDLELTFEAGGQRTRVLVENKLDAPLQPRQAQRYRKRGVDAVATRRCDAFLTVLLAPDAYAKVIKGFDRTLTYEAIERFLSACPDPDGRIRHKLLLLRSAIARAAEGWKLVPDEQATAFWMRYWDLAKRLAPQLQMPRPAAKPATSGFVRFRPAELGRGVELLHKVPYGHVDLQFAQQAEKLAEFARRHGTHLESDMQIARAGKSLVVRIDVPRASVGGPVEESEVGIREGIRAARRLLTWCVRWVGRASTTRPRSR